MRQRPTPAEPASAADGGSTREVSASSAEGEPIMLVRRGPTLDYWEGED